MSSQLVEQYNTMKSQLETRRAELLTELDQINMALGSGVQANQISVNGAEVRPGGGIVVQPHNSQPHVIHRRARKVHPSGKSARVLVGELIRGGISSKAEIIRRLASEGLREHNVDSTISACYRNKVTA